MLCCALAAQQSLQSILRSGDLLPARLSRRIVRRRQVAMTGPESKGRRGRPPGGSSEETHARIIGAARSVFAESGYSGAQNRRMAEQAGVTTSTLYHYFDSKLVLYVSVFRDAEQLVANRYRVALADPGSAIERLDRLVGAALALHEEDASVPLFLASVPGEMRMHREIARAIAKTPVSTDRILREVLETAAQRGELAADVDLDAATQLLFAMTVGVALYASTRGNGGYAAMLGALRQVLAGKLFVHA